LGRDQGRGTSTLAALRRDQTLISSVLRYPDAIPTLSRLLSTALGWDTGACPRRHRSGLRHDRCGLGATCSALVSNGPCSGRAD